MPARPARPSHKPRILVAVDLSPASQEAVAAGARLAKDLHAEIVLVHATGTMDPPSLVGMPPIGAPGLDPAHPKPYTDRIQELAMVSTAHQMAQSLKDQGLMVTVVERAGPAVEVILEEMETRNCLMAVVGKSGHGAFKAALLGSVAGGLVRNSRRPILVVPGPGK